MKKYTTSIIVAGFYVTLPGASAQVTVDFSKISTRLRNSLIQGLKDYPKDISGYGKAYKMMHLLRENFRFGRSMLGEDRVSVDLDVPTTHPELAKKFLDHCKAHIVAERLEKSGDAYFDRYSTSQMETLTENFNDGRLYYWGRHAFSSDAGQQLLNEITEIVREHDKAKLDEAMEVVVGGRCIHISINN